jgi:hypothetical protein
VLREEHRLTVLENMVLRRTFAPRMNGVTSDWRELQNEELHKFVPLTEYY